jgi:hypothetical protein
MRHGVAELELPAESDQEDEGRPGSLTRQEEGGRSRHRGDEDRPGADLADNGANTTDQRIGPDRIQEERDAVDLGLREAPFGGEALRRLDAPTEPDATDGVENGVVDDKDEGGDRGNPRNGSSIGLGRSRKQRPGSFSTGWAVIGTGGNSRWHWLAAAQAEAAPAWENYDDSSLRMIVPTRSPRSARARRSGSSPLMI